MICVAMKITKKKDILRQFCQYSVLAIGVVLLATTPACGGSAASSAAPAPLTSAATLRQAGDARNIKIGTAAQARLLGQADYTGVLGREFSQLEGEYEMKFDPSHPRPDTDPNPYDLSLGEQLVSFAQAHNMAVRGHTLVWHEAVPAWVKNGGYSAAQLNTILQGHITTVVKLYSGRIYAWDVYNEAFNDDGTVRGSIWYDAPGIGMAGQGTRTIEQALRWARAADSRVKLFYNDYGTETANPKSDAIYAMAQDFKQRGVPLDGIGFQMHVELSLNHPSTIAALAANLKRFADLGLEVQITELDIRLPSNDAAMLTQQAALYGQIVSTCAKQPKCTAIQTWGFTDKYSWIPGFFKGFGWALPFDDQYGKKAAYNSYVKGLQ